VEVSRFYLPVGKKTKMSDTMHSITAHNGNGAEWHGSFHNMERKNKVLFVIDTLQLGGAEQSLLDNAMRFKNLLPVICHLYKGDLLKPRFVAHGIPVHSVNIKRKYGFLQGYKMLKQIVEEEQPDIIVAYLTRSEIVSRLVARFYHIPVIGTFVSDLYSKTYNRSLSWRAKAGVSVFKYINKATSRLCKGFVANSETIKHLNAAQLQIAANNIEVIHRGRNSKVFTYSPPNIVTGKPTRFLNVGRLVPVKGQRDLILAFKEFLQACPHAVLHIIGEGPARASLTQLIDELGLQEKVILMGARSDIPQLINEYDCFVFPSYSEGFSGSVVEAMFAGLPVLASDIPVNKEAVEHMQTGYLFRKGSVEAITKAMVWFNENRTAAAAMAEKAYAYALQHFELETIAAKLEHYLQKMIIEEK
jgi:glycosyltransferase involved in cell wall biosynthesis